MSLFYVVCGILFLYGGGELLVSGSVSLARALGVRPLIVGLTVVAFGTSSPELAASLFAAFAEAPDMVLGNVIGSNILNIGAILGLTALLYPLTTQVQLLRRDIPVMIGAGALLFLLIPDHLIGRVEGLLLFVLLGLYLVLLYTERKRSGDNSTEKGEKGRLKKIWLAILFVVAGIGLLTLGASWLIKGAKAIAESYGVSERIIGLTIVAFGTSLPELASCLVAAVRRQGDLLLGNLVGSSIFNVLAILGLTALVHPVDVNAPGVFRLDLLIMIGFSLVAFTLLAIGKTLKKWKGAVLTLLYAAYIAYLIIGGNGAPGAGPG